MHELNRKKIQSSKKRGVEPFLTAEEGLKKVKRGGYAFHVDIATAYKIIEVITVNEVRRKRINDIFIRFLYFISLIGYIFAR